VYLGWTLEGLWWNDVRGSTHMASWADVREDLARQETTADKCRQDAEAYGSDDTEDPTP